jgi:hypothetical protein
LEDGVLAVGVETPAGGGDDLAVTIEGGVAADEVEDGVGGVYRR